MTTDPFAEKWFNVPAHPVANLFPMMSDSELKELSNDIKANGQREPIIEWNGQIVDGRNRLKACQMAGIIPDTLRRPFEDEAEVARYICSLNIHRRHLTTSQRAMIAVELKKPFAEAAKVRQLANLKQGDIAPVMQTFAQREDEHENTARKEAAQVMGVSGFSVQKAQAVKAASPELAAKVAAGEVTVNKAYTQVKAEWKAREKAEELPAEETEEDEPSHTVQILDEEGDVIWFCRVPSSIADKIKSKLEAHRQ